VLDLVDVDSGKWARYARQVLPPMRWVYALEAQCLQRIESGRTDELTAISLISEAEVATYRRGGGHHPNVHVISNGVDMDYFVPQPEHNDPVVCFVGVWNYKPNVDAVCWFARKVLPALRARVGVRSF
jgi:glycosyltransferase involved in cell wall biosynthesis